MSLIRSQNETKTIVLSNDVQEVPRLGIFVKEVCSDMGLEKGDSIGVNLAVEEAVVNVMLYAYPQGTRGEVTVTATASEESLIFEIRDQGQPFDPTKAKDADVSLGLKERKIGGLGIYLMRHYMNEIRYERRNNENILMLILRISEVKGELKGS